MPDGPVLTVVNSTMLSRDRSISDADLILGWG